MERKTFSPERLYKIRRLRKARRLFKQIPLFAYHTMQTTDDQYRYDDFLDDLRLRKARPVKMKKSYRIKYGRYDRMWSLIFEYRFTKDVNLILQAQKLKNNMTKPYTVRFRIKTDELECTFPPTIDIKRIDDLVNSSKTCTTIEEVEELVKKFRNQQCFTIN